MLVISVHFSESFQTNQFQISVIQLSNNSFDNSEMFMQVPICFGIVN